jgi:ComF family protein
MYNVAMSNGRVADISRKGLGVILDSLTRLIWPPVCQSCGKATPESSGSLCHDCWNDVLRCTAGTYCPRCGKDTSLYAIVDGRCPDCVSAEIHFDGIARAGLYDGVLRRMVVDFKAADRTDLDSHFRLLANSALAGASFAGDIDLFVPVPLHWTRRLSRGYNQSMLIARLVSHPTASISTDLVRMRRTHIQPGYRPEQRARNVRGAFAVRRGHGFEGKTICLVDDVKTTGATLNECAMTLRAAGARRVYALVIAVAGQRAN